MVHRCLTANLCDYWLRYMVSALTICSRPGRFWRLEQQALAAEHATGEQLATLADEIAEMYANLNDPQQYLVHDICFHRAVAAASNNPTLVTLVEMVSAVMYERRRETIERAHDFSESLELHQQVYRAIRARQPEEARAAMREHIVRAQQAFALEESEEKTTKEVSKD